MSKLETTDQIPGECWLSRTHSRPRCGMIRPEAGSEIGADWQPAAVLWGARRLWSLWDMLSFSAGAFTRAIATVGGLHTLTAQLQAGEQLIPPDAKNGLRTAVLAKLIELRDECVAIELVTSMAAIDNCISFLKKETDHWPRTTQSLLQYICQVVPDELKGRMFFYLNAAEAEYYSAPLKGWENVLSRFNDALADIEEMSKCFAFGRYAAAVFHSLQVVEIGVIELGNLIGAKDHQTGWNATTLQLKKIYATKHQDRTPFQQTNAQFLEQIYAATDILMRAWRNKVSHAQGKLVVLTTNFSGEVASEIISASRGFMRRLATEAPIEPDSDA